MPQYLWADAVCINQQDIGERTREVPKMLMIYEKATRMIIWLGVEEENSNMAIDFMASTIAKWEEAGPSMQPDVPHLHDFLEEFHASPRYAETWLALANLSSGPWFSRTWIVQEYIAYKRARYSAEGGLWLF